MEKVEIIDVDISQFQTAMAKMRLVHSRDKTMASLAYFCGTVEAAIDSIKDKEDGKVCVEHFYKVKAQGYESMKRKNSKEDL